MSVEAHARRAFWRVIFYRFVGEVLIAIPRRLLFALHETVLELEKLAFYCELDAARRYKNLTDIDLAATNGDIRRYAGLDTARMDRLSSIALGDDVEEQA